MNYNAPLYPRLSEFGKEMFRKYPMTEYSNELKIDDEVAALFAYVTIMKNMVNDMAQGVETMGKFTEELLEEFTVLRKWVEEEGLEEKVILVLNEWFDNGKLFEIINNEVLKSKADVSYVNEKVQAISMNYKESFSTLEDLEIAYPNGDAFNHVVLSNNMIYTWIEKTSRWENTYIVANGTSVPDKSITLNKVTFNPIISETQSKNLFNKNSITEGKFVVGSTGVIGNNPDYFISDPIPVEPNTTYTRPRPEQLSIRDINGQHISGLTNQSPAAFTTPENAAFVIVTDKLANLETYQIEKGAVSTEYQPYGYMVTENLLTDDLKEDLNYKAIDWVPSTNLFDKNSVTNGKFISYVNGQIATPTLQPISDWNASDWIPVKPNTTYIPRFKEQLAISDKNRNFIVGYPNSRTENGFTTPNNAAWLRMTVKTEHLESQQLNEGSALLSYEPYGKKISRSQLEIESTSNGDNMVTVRQLFSTYLHSGGEGVILADSNGAGYGTTGYSQDGELIGNSGVLSSPNSHSWANRLVDVVSDIKSNCVLRNWGISGWSTKNFVNQGINNFIKNTDKIVFVVLGTNDRLKTNSTSISDFENRLQQIVDRCNTLNIPCVLMSCIPASVGNDNNKELYAFDTFEVDNAVRRIATKNNMFYINNYDWFLKYEEENGNMNELYSDELHMTDYGSYNYLFRNIINELGISYRRSSISR